ncbi:MAG: hypothetical protein SFW67_19485 [Myxococcaceae bacterium]|nr:hypothetical protein [Myxococcaceae bacterium]
MVLELLVSVATAATPQKARLAILSLQGAGDVDPALAAAMTESLAAEVGARGFFEPISSAEIATLLGVERQRQLLGCGDEAASCTAELAGALGAPYVMSGSLTRLEGIFQLNLQVSDTVKGRVTARSTKVARDFESLRGLLPWAVAEACGTPLPPPPSRALPITLIVAGGAAVITGAVFGLLALNEEAALRGELRSDDMNRSVVLRSADSYRDQLERTALQRTLSLCGLVAGAALVTLGLVVMPPEAPQTGVRASLVPTSQGFAIVGFMP